MTEYNFKLTHDEYMDLILFQFENSRSLKIVRIWLRLSIPLLILLLVMFFKIYNDFDLLTIFVLLALLWISIFPKVWKAVIKNKASKRRESFANEIKFENTKITVESENIYVTSDSYDKNYSMKSIKHIVLLDKVLLVFVDKEVICFPKRIFENSDPIDLITTLTKKAGYEIHV